MNPRHLPLLSLLRSIATVFASITVLVSCSSGYEKPGKTVMAPTPIAMAMKHAGVEAQLRKKDLKQTVPVYICSSRNLRSDSKTVDPFGNQRSTKLVPYLALAHVSIGSELSDETLIYETVNSVKKKQTRVKVESIKMFESPDITPFSSASEKREAVENNSWIVSIRKQIKQSKRKEITVFVHGYNTHMVSNTELLAEIYHYGGREGVVVNYEWPSAGKLLGYFQDKGNAEYSTRLFRSFISRLARITGADKVKIIAHSAGNPIVVNALKELRLLNSDLNAKQLQQKFKISHVILAAPDMDSMRFMNAVFDRFYEITPSVNVYAYTKDRALLISSKLFNISRLGNAIGKLTGWQKVALKQAKNVYLIDVTEPQKQFGSLLGHGYFHRDPWVSSDIILSNQTKNPRDRGLIKKKNSVFWEFPHDYPQRLRTQSLRSR